MTENMKEAEYVKITEETTEGTATETVTEEKVVVSGDDSGRQGDSIENYGYEEVPGEDITGFEELAGFGEMSDTKNDQEQRLFRIMDEMDKVDRNAMIEALERQEKLAKPPGSLGGLEEISIRMAGIFSRWGWWSRSLCPGGVNPPSPTKIRTEKCGFLLYPNFLKKNRGCRRGVFLRRQA